MDSLNREWVDWLPWSLRPGEARGTQKARSGAANCTATPVGRVGMAGCRWRVSEWDTGLELMQEWKFGAEGKASVCKGIWWKWIGKRPAISRGSK